MMRRKLQRRDSACTRANGTYDRGVKKLLVVLVLAGLSIVVYTKVFRQTPAERTCSKLNDLCAADGKDKLDMGECRDGLAEARKMFGNDAVDRAVTCVADSNSCMEAVGCVVGAGMRSFDQLEKGMERGFGSAK